MMNAESEPDDADAASRRDAAVHVVVRSGPGGAAVLAGIATAIVVALWFAFYFLVFVPRAGAP
jgi:hypothetical protein